MYLRKIQISFYFKKNSDLHLMKMQINFLFWEKFRSTSNEDVDQLLFEKILDLHLMKMQVHFYF